MQISVKNTSNLERKVRVELPGEQVSTAINNRLQNMTKTTKVQGFRPGKVPLKVIQGRYGVQVRKEVMGELVQSSFYEAITKENLKPVGQPQIDDIDDESGKYLAYTATFEIYPETTLKSVDGIAIEKPICNVSDKDISEMIEVLRKQRRALKPVDRPSQDGDTIDINFEGFMDSEPFEDGRADSYQLELGSANFIEGFEAGLVGKSAGEDVTLKLTFPEDYSKQALKGKDVEFKVKINTVNEPVLPEVDVDFMKVFGVKDGNKESFQNEIRRNMEREVGLTLRRQIKDMVLDKLREENTVELPQVLVVNERHRIQHELENNLKQQGMDVDTLAKADPALITGQAENRVSLQLIVTEIVRQNELKADPVKVRKMIEQAASGYEDPSAVVNWYYSDQKNLAEIEALALEDSVIDWVLAHAKVTEKACTFDEVMNKRQTAVLKN